MTRSRAGIVAVLLVGITWAMLQQAPGANQNAHFALVRAVADGTPRIDRYRTETPDVSYVDGHYYAAKAPGLALATEPWYLVLRGLGLAVTDRAWHTPAPAAMGRVPRSALWELSLVGAALPALVTLLLVRWVADGLVPGRGTGAAVLLGLGSTLGVFATLFFAHALSAALGFAAFAALVAERRRPGLRRVAAAGALAGLGIVVEFPLALVAAVLAAYAAATGARLRRLVAFAAGAVAGLVPLAVFDTWAFGSPFTLSYADAVSITGRSGHDVIGANSAGVFGVQVPSLRAALDLLVSGKGLLVLGPVWALGTLGVVHLWRAGRRAEAAVIATVVCAFVLYDSAYYLPFGGFPGGPRLLVPMLPFLAVAVAGAAATWPLPTLSLGLASVAVTVAALVVDPGTRSEDAGTWFHELERGHVTRTVVGWLGGGDRTGVAVAVAAAAVAVAAAVVAHPPPVRVDLRGVTAAVAVLVLWRAVYIAAPILLEQRVRTAFALVVTVGLLAAAAAALALLRLAGPAGLLPLAVLVPLAWPRAAAHDWLDAAAVVLSLAVAAVVARRGGILAREAPAA